MATTSACPFCDLAQGRNDSWFEQVYPSCRSRKVAEQGAVFATPTVGQLFAGSLLIVANRHVERFAEAPDLQSDVVTLLDSLMPQVGAFGVPLVYEHGARCANKGGCGIYHAHVHIVPLPIGTKVCDLTGMKGTPVKDLKEAWCTSAFGPDYLIVQTGDETEVLQSTEGFGSQFMRKRLVDWFALGRQWDWRKYESAEPDLIKTMSHFGVEV